MSGAFTGARDRKGRAEAATGGTLFLDEIGELPLAVQPKLLQLLQTRGFQRVGSAAQQTADIRLIAATNVDLEAAVAAGRFREDLYFRLDVLPIAMPSLSDRRTDLPVLVEALLAKICRENGFADLRASEALLLAIRVSDWPGNIRQLENVLTRAAARAAALRCGPCRAKPRLRRGLGTAGEPGRSRCQELSRGDAGLPA